MRPFDLDAHIIEPQDLWLRGLPQRWQRRAPRHVEDSWGFRRLLVESQLVPTPEGPGRAPQRVLTEEESLKHRARRAASAAPDSRLAFMRANGIARALLLPSQAMALSLIRDGELAAACCHVYNEYITAYCGGYREELFGAAVLPMQDPARAMQTLVAAIDMGVRAVCIRAHPYGALTLGDALFDPIYAAAAEAGLPLIVHEAAGFTRGTAPGIDRFESGLCTHAIWHPFEQMLAATSLIIGGVLERHPKLRVVFAEAGAGWAPYWLDRLDSHCRTFAWEVPWLRHSPSTYFVRQCLVAVEAHDDLLPFAMQRLGAQCVAFATDYPHSDSEMEGALDSKHLSELSSDDRALYLSFNAERLFGLAK